MSKKIKRLGIMTAMEEEFRRIAAHFKFTAARNIGPRTFLSADEQGIELVLVPSRIGKVAAAVTTSILIHDFKVDAVLFTGVAGSTDRVVRVGDIVVADHVVQHDIDLKGVLGCNRFDIPLLGVREMPCSSMLVETAARAAQVVATSKEYCNELQEFTDRSPMVQLGVVASGDTFICDDHERDSLSSSIRNIRCVEMEGAAVGQVCMEHDIPFVVVRIISDDASNSAKVDFSAFLADAASIGSELMVRSFVQALAERKE